MPDRDKDALAERNRETFLAARLPAGLKPEVAAAAAAAGESVSALVTAALRKELRGRETGMSKPDIQYFERTGTWEKPAGALRVDVILQGAEGGKSEAPLATAGRSDYDALFTRARLGTKLSPDGYVASNGEPGEISVSSFNAADLPDTVDVAVGKGGRPGGRDGYALIVTHLRESQ